jgi:hypothetical protein
MTMLGSYAAHIIKGTIERAPAILLQPRNYRYNPTCNGSTAKIVIHWNIKLHSCPLHHC